jgi:hypothetical protein
MLPARYIDRLEHQNDLAEIQGSNLVEIVEVRLHGETVRRSLPASKLLRRDDGEEGFGSI